MKLRFYVLTTRSLFCLRRQFITLPIKETTVVINTRDEKYKEKAIEYCKEIGVEYFVTESNGTPGKGKNALRNIFFASEHEYCVQIDGDDLVTAYGVDYYKAVAEKENAPDVLINLHTIGFRRANEFKHHAGPTVNNYRDHLENLKKEYPVKTKDIDRALENYDLWYAGFDELFSLSKIWNYPLDHRDIKAAPRFVFWSKKAHQCWSFDEKLMVGEDTLATWWVRDAAFRGHIKLELVMDDIEKTYIYDFRRSGIMKPNNQSLYWGWVLPLVSKMKEDSNNWIVPFDFSFQECVVDIPKDKQINFRRSIKEYFL
jgi:hypothetical protein